jgi:nicotinamidase/pyrazinamidase
MLFWDVDTQLDFIDPQGKLYVPGAETIVPQLQRLTNWAAERGVLVIASACAHHPGDAEFRQYPPHCLVGTSGQQKIPETRLPNALILPNHFQELPADFSRYSQIILEKQQLDVFTNPNTERVLERLGPAQDIALYGVVTEICVSYAARGLLRRGHRVRIVSDAVRPLEQQAADSFLEEVGRSGAELVTTEELLHELLRPRAA